MGEELHSRFGQIVDIDTLGTFIETRQRMRSLILQINGLLDQFYQKTGTSGEFFFDTVGPNVSTPVFKTWVNYWTQRQAGLPDFDFTSAYVTLATEINKYLLEGTSFDTCLKLYEQRYQTITEERIRAQLHLALEEGHIRLRLHNHSAWRGQEDPKMTERDRKLWNLLWAQALVNNYSWSKKDASGVLKNHSTDSHLSSITR